MAAKKPNSNQANETLIQFTLTGLIVFSASLLIVSAGLTYFLAAKNTGGKFGFASGSVATASPVSQPWGELITHDIELERPEEYVAYESEVTQPPAWVFPGMTVDKVRELILASGLTAAQAQQALLPEHVTATTSNITVHPDEELILQLSSQVRGKLYHELSVYGENHYMHFPFVFPGNSFKTIVAEHKIDGSAVALIEKLLYPRASDQCFSDLELVLRHLPAKDDRIKLVQALSRQSAVLARLRIGPETDIDKLLNYWTAVPGVRLKDARPLLESVKRLPEGGSVSLLYMLPQFARQRLYTFPQPNKPGDARMDCHWSTMNFFNEVPDNRFNDSAYTTQFLSNNYYPIGKPTAYGDLIFLLDEHNNALHSAVYIADDLVFTKNGDNYLQPWMLMHLKDLLGLYATAPPPRMLVYRNNKS